MTKLPNGEKIKKWLKVCRICGKTYEMSFEVKKLPDGRILGYQLHKYECTCHYVKCSTK